MTIDFKDIPGLFFSKPTVADTEACKKVLKKYFKLQDESINKLFEFIWIKVRLNDLYQSSIYFYSALFMMISMFNMHGDKPQFEKALINLESESSIAYLWGALVVETRERVLIAFMTAILFFRTSSLMDRFSNLYDKKHQLNENRFSRLNAYENRVNRETLGAIFSSFIIFCYIIFNNQKFIDRVNVVRIFLVTLSYVFFIKTLSGCVLIKDSKNNSDNRNKINLHKFLEYCYQEFLRRAPFQRSDKNQIIKFQSHPISVKGYKFCGSYIEIPINKKGEKKEDNRRAFLNVIFMTLHRLGFSIISRSDESILFITTGIAQLTQDHLQRAFHDAINKTIASYNEENARFLKLEEQARNKIIAKYNKEVAKYNEKIARLQKLKKEQRKNKNALKYTEGKNLDAIEDTSDALCPAAAECKITRLQEQKAESQEKKTKTKTRLSHSARSPQNNLERSSRLNIICWSNARGDEHVYDPEDDNAYIFPVTDRANTFVIFILWGLSNSDFNNEKQHKEVKSKAMTARFGGNRQRWVRLWVNEVRQRVTYGRSGRSAELLKYQLALKLLGQTYGNMRILARREESFSSTENIPIFIADAVCNHAHKR